MNLIKNYTFITPFIIILASNLYSNEKNEIRNNTLRESFMNDTKYTWSKHSLSFTSKNIYMIADIQSLHSGKQLLLGILIKNEDDPNEKNYIKDVRIFPYVSGNIMPCFGPIYYSARAQTLSYPVAIKINSEDSKVYIIEHGFEISSQNNSTFMRSLQLSTDEDDVEWKRKSTTTDQIHLHQLLHFPNLLAAILQQSRNGTLGGEQFKGCSQKFIDFHEVQLPKNYKEFQQHPFGDKNIQSWNNLPQDFQNKCSQKYKTQRINHERNHGNKRKSSQSTLNIIDRNQQFGY